MDASFLIPASIAYAKTLPKSIFLVPGYGAQGGGARDVAACFNTDGYGAIVHSARDVIFAYQKAIRERNSERRPGRLRRR